MAREMMIAEQNAAYQESLAADREKLKKKEQQRLQEEEEREEREVSANKQCTLQTDYNTMYKSWKLLRGKTMCKLQCDSRLCKTVYFSATAFVCNWKSCIYVNWTFSPLVDSSTLDSTLSSPTGRETEHGECGAR